MKKTIIAIIVVLVLIGFVLIQPGDKMCQGVKIAGLDVSNQTLSAAQETIEEKWADFVQQRLTFNYDTGSLSTSTITDFGFQLNKQKTLERAYQIGRQSNFLINFKERVSSLLSGYDFEIVYDFDREKFKSQIDIVFEEIETKPQDATLVFSEGEFVLQLAIRGITVDQERFLNDLLENIRSLSNDPINLSISSEDPSIQDNEVGLAQEKAKKILAGQPYKVHFEDNVWTIKESDLIDWIKFEPTISGNSDNYILGAYLNKDKIENHLSKIAWSTNQPVLNAELKIENGRAVVFTLPQEGFGVQTDKTANLLIANILAEPPVKDIELFVGKTSPEKSSLADTNDLGINGLIGQGKSNFSGSPANRIHNIKTGAAKFDGLILEPGQEFSFNKLLGGSGEEEGFLAELVIKNNELIPEYGGGLCQVSTTLFRAAVYAGLEIVERKPHAFPISYYSPHGFDATVYDPKPDLRFINDTPNYLLIQSIVQGNNLTFNFYGDNEGQTAEVIGPTIVEKEEDGSMRTILTRKIYQDGILVRSENFVSNYDSPDNYERVEE